MSLRIRTLKLVGIRQFRDVTFDFTDPKTGKPLERVCLLGGNGTGKSTILRLLAESSVLGIPSVTPSWFRDLPEDAAMYVELEFGNRIGCFEGKPGQLMPHLWTLPFHVQSQKSFEYARRKAAESALADSTDAQIGGDAERQNCIAVYCPPDAELAPASSSLLDVPDVCLNDSLQFLKQPTTKFLVGQDKVEDFWKLLIALIKDREARLLAYNRLPENQNRTISEVENEFLAQNPDILKELSEFWEPILDKAGLRFDYLKASQPVQLTDNLKAYICLSANNTILPYAELSTGIRHFLFRLGHLFTIFRYHKGKGGVVLVDEPENSLYPDFQYDLLSHYNRAAPGTQMFFATHSPIVAAQFKPEERFILEFDAEHGVIVRRGVTPEGDDPNDILLKDFAVRTLYGEKGMASWNRFRELNRLIESETDSTTRKSLIKEYLELGRSYNFDPHNEISAQGNR